MGKSGMPERVRVSPGDGLRVELERLAGDIAISHVMGRGDGDGGFSVVFTEQGSGQVALDGIERPLAAGVWCVSDAPLALQGRLRGWLLRLDQQPIEAERADLDLARWVRRLVPGVYPASAVDRPRSAAFFEALGAELAPGVPSDRGAVRALIELIVLLCSRAATAVGEVETVPAWSARLADEVIDVVDRRFTERLSLADVAVELARSPASVARATRQATGRSVLELIAERRLREARTLPLESDQSAGEIAQRIGYPSMAYFHRVFRRASGTTPQRWREDHRRRSPHS